MFKIIYVSFEPGAGYDRNEITPETIDGKFESIKEAKEYLKTKWLENVKTDVVYAIGEKAEKEVEYEIYEDGNRVTIDAFLRKIDPYNPAERYEFTIVEIKD